MGINSGNKWPEQASPSTPGPRISSPTERQYVARQHQQGVPHHNKWPRPRNLFVPIGLRLLCSNQGHETWPLRGTNKENPIAASCLCLKPLSLPQMGGNPATRSTWPESNPPLPQSQRLRSKIGEKQGQWQEGPQVAWTRKHSSSLWVENPFSHL